MDQKITNIISGIVVFDLFFIVIVDVSTGCSDDDGSSPNNDLTYVIESVDGVNGNAGKFQVGSNTGQLEFASQPNYEAASDHIVVITVSSSGLNILHQYILL